MPFGFEVPGTPGYNQNQPAQPGGNVFTDEPSQTSDNVFVDRPQQPAPEQDGTLGWIQDTFGGPKGGYMAIGKTPKGEAYYGEGLEGWGRKTFAKFFNPADRTEGVDYARQDEIELEARTAADQWAQQNPNLAAYKDYYQAFKQSGMLNKERVESGEATALGIGMQEAQKVVKTAVLDVGIMGILQAGDIGMRKVLAAGEGVDEITGNSTLLNKWGPYNSQLQWMRDNLPGGNNLADLVDNFNPATNQAALAEYTKQQFEQGDYMQAGAGAGLTFLSLISPVLSPWLKGVAGITEASPLKEKSDAAIGIDNAQDTAIMQRNLMGSNLIYTQMFDSLVKADVMRDLEAGVPPTFVEEKYVNPWVELAGSLVIDPLNVLGGGAKQVGKFLNNAQDLTKITPEVKTALGALADTAKTVDAPTVQKAVEQVTQTVLEKTKSLEKLASNYGATALTANGKQFVTSRTVGGFLSFMVGQNVDDLDEAANFISKMADMATAGADDVAKRTELLDYFAKARGGEQVFTEAGYATMAVFREMLGEGGDVAKFTEKLMKSMEGATTAAEKTEMLAAKAAQMVEDATAKIFPNVDQIKKLDPEKYAKLPTHVKVLNDFLGKSSLIGDGYRKANAMFAGIYMGLSPAFAIRNALANTVSIIADQGMSAGLRGGAAQLGNMFKPGALHQRNLDDLTKALGSLPRDLVGDVQTMAGDTGATGAGLGGLYEKWAKSMANTANWSQNAEVAARAALYRNAVVAEIERGIRTALPGMDALKKGGFSDAQVNLLVDLVRKNRGQVKDAIKEFSEAITKSGGVIDAAQLVQPSQKMRGFLQKLNLDGALDAARHGGYNSAEEFRKATDEILDNVRKVADSADNELARVAEGSTEAKLIDNLLGDVKGPLGKTLDSAFNHMAQTFRTAREAAYKAADQAMTQSFEAAKQAGDWNAAQMIDAARSKLGDVMREPLGEKVASGLDAHRTLVRGLADQVKRGALSPQQALGKMQITFPSGKVFNGADVFDAGDKFGDFVFQKYLPALSGEWWGDFNHLQYSQVADALAKLGADAENILAPAKELMGEGFRLQDAIVQAKGDPNFINTALSGAEEAMQATENAATGPIADILSKAKQAGWKRGAKGLLNAVNEGLETPFKSINDAPSEALEAALKARGVDISQVVTEAQKVTESAADVIGQAAQKVKKPFVKSADVMHSLPGAVREQVDEFAKEFARWQDNVAQNWGKAEPGAAFEQLDGATLARWADEAERRMVQVRRVADEVGRASGDFALHAYKDKTYLDTALSFIYPYHYWYGRTYKNWAQRMVTRPDFLAGYGKYRRTMEQLHAGMPEFWKYNLSTNDLPGVETENPLYFNLEATLNPINGITGSDFTDRKKRVDWLSRTVDDMGKFGPSMFSPISWLMAAKLYKDGENDAAARWMGRFLPQSSSVKAAAGLLGKNVEIDPFVNLFQGGLDPYERNRVGRALGALVQEGIITEEQAIDAANSQSGDIWDAAKLRATQQRAPGQLASFIGGVGFKGRNPSDIEIDNFYNDYYMLMGASSNIPPDVYREAMTELQKKYPFMDAVLISRKADDDRNSAYAYNVIGRIPPGSSGDMLKAAGLTQDMITRFYDGKGSFKGWTPTDTQRFMSGIGDLGAMLALPDNPTRQEWDAARNASTQMYNQMKQQFGTDIMDKIDLYYTLPTGKKEVYLAQHPEITEAFNYKSQAYATDPLLYKYFGGIENLNKFYKSQMYTALEQKYGADISDKWDQYYAMQLTDPKGAKAYYKQHPELAQYSKDKKAFQDEILRASTRIAAYMPSGPEVPIREDFKPESQYQQDIFSAAQGVQGQQYSPQEWQATLGDPLYRLMVDYWQNGEELSSAAERQLGYDAKKLGYASADAALQAFGITYFQSQGGMTP